MAKLRFAGWDRVARELHALADADGPFLSAGQRDSLRALATGLPRHGMIVADEVGMGKTRIAAALARAVTEAGGRVAIVIPPTLDFQWRDELERAGLPDVPEVVRSMSGFLGVWSKQAVERAWFDEQVLLISQWFTNWRLGARTERWRFALLPLIAARARKAKAGRFPPGFREMEGTEKLVGEAAESIVAYCNRPSSPEARRRFADLASPDKAWSAASDAENYSSKSSHRPLLEQAVGLGLGAFDLIVVDEAHKGRGEDTGLSRLLENTLLARSAARRLCMTATPLELRADDWEKMLARIQLDRQQRDRIRRAIDGYSAAARRLRLAWRSSPEARRSYIEAARAFQAALGPYVLRRDKREDEAVARFRAAVLSDRAAMQTAAGGTVLRDSEAYRWQHDIPVKPADLDPAWRRAVCAAEALSFAVPARDDPALKRLRLTFGSGHGLALRLDAATASDEDYVRQSGDPKPGTNEFGLADVDSAADAPPEPTDPKRVERARWWRRIIDRVVEQERALYSHPAILAAVAAIERYDREGEKVLVFGRFTRPMSALVSLLNARAMLRAIDAGTPWPQSVIVRAEIAAVAAAHRQLGRVGPFDHGIINTALKGQYGTIESQREKLRGSLFTLIEEGLQAEGSPLRTLAQAARSAGDEDRALLAAAIDQLLPVGTPVNATSVDDRLSPGAVADAFDSLIRALREHDEWDPDAKRDLDSHGAGNLWAKIAKRLKEEYGTDRGRFARLMNGATKLHTRRALQLAFNRAESNPRVLVAQSVVGREGLNLHRACRVVILLHPEWNPGVVEQQIGRVDRMGSRWAQQLESGRQPLPRIEIRPVIFEGTYDAHHWRVLQDRWDDLRAQLHGVVVPHRAREGCSAEELALIREIDEAAPCFSPRILSGARTAKQWPGRRQTVATGRAETGSA